MENQIAIDTSVMATYIAIGSLIISVVSVLASNYLSWKKIKKDMDKTVINEQYKGLKELKENMANIIGISYDLLRRSRIIARSDGSPRWEENKEYNRLAIVEMNKYIALVKMGLDINKYNWFFDEADDFTKESYKLNRLMTNAEDDKDEKKYNEMIIIFERECYEIIKQEENEILNFSQK